MNPLPNFAPRVHLASLPSTAAERPVQPGGATAERAAVHTELVRRLCNGDWAGACDLIPAMQGCQLATLDLKGVELLRKEQVDALADFLGHPACPITHVNLRGASVIDIAQILKALGNRSNLIALNLSGLRICPKEGQSLDLRDENILQTIDVVKANPGLKALSLGRQSLVGGAGHIQGGHSHLPDLLAALSAVESLDTLDLSSCNLDFNDAKALCGVLGSASSKLGCLNLSGNALIGAVVHQGAMTPADPNVACTLVHALGVSPNLTILHLPTEVIGNWDACDALRKEIIVNGSRLLTLEPFTSKIYLLPFQDDILSLLEGNRSMANCPPAEIHARPVIASPDASRAAAFFNANDTTAIAKLFEEMAGRGEHVLDLSGVTLTAAGCSALATALRNPDSHVAGLCLKCAKVASMSDILFTDNFNLLHLKTLNLAGVRWGTPGEEVPLSVEHFALISDHVQRSRSLELLDLSGQPGLGKPPVGGGATCIQRLANALSKSSLVTLNLAYCNLTPADGTALVIALSPTFEGDPSQLRCLHLEGNEQVGEECVEALIVLHKNAKLFELHLPYFTVSSEALVLKLGSAAASDGCVKIIQPHVNLAMMAEPDCNIFSTSAATTPFGEIRNALAMRFVRQVQSSGDILL